MKKLLITLTTFLLIFTGLTVVKADTLYRTSNKNGEVDLSVLTNQGYVGALDMTVMINGNVKLNNLTWDSSLKDNYIKKYTYKNNQIRVYIATGNTAQNLALKNGEIKIGTIKVTSKTNNNETFNITIDKLIATDIDYNSITKNNLKTDSNDSFTYMITPKGSTKTQELKKSSNNKANETSNSSNATQEINEPNTTSAEAKETEFSKDKVPDKVTEEKKEEKNNYMIFIVILITALIGGNIIGVVIYNQRKK